MIRWRGSWYADRFRPGIEVLPERFLAAAESGESVQERIDLPTGEVVAVAIPLDDGSYVEVFPLDELNQTLATLAVTFAGTTTVATALGVLVGRWASRRALSPLATVTAAAGAIAGGDLGARIGMQRDADLNALAEAFDDTATKLEARVERDARFAADVSHELRSPLTTMVNAVDLLLDRLQEMQTETQEILLLLSDEVHRFAEMVKDLLELALLEASSAPLAEQEVAVRELVASVADRLTGREVTRTPPGEDPVLTLDPRRLERIVENLVRNAETHGNGVTGVWVESKGDGVRLIVEDHGPGVGVEARERIFDRFAKGTTSARSSGVGLGLSLVSEHVRMNGGRVWVEDGPQGGARFVVELPASPEADDRPRVH
jgi:signal transduction histidine kinase